ncbi:reverse transcriptase domain-containing protein [Microbacterium suaedae]|uniref:reverse transcriptase domain-containing protein n=1 Tax=Microbacterium suaedae TaxID=2067813 RepID=UPI000DA26515|nr:reverse transcriptase domain-containing protein [Microbacterium suaedae]
MKVSPADASKLDLKATASEIATNGLLDMPFLISERSLESSTDTLARHAKTRASTGYTPSMEIVVMPKRGHGLRPISVLSPTTRLIYEAIVAKLAPSLPVPSRNKTFDQHRSYGEDADGPNQDDPHVRVLDLDIVAFYEYVDHQILFEELLARTLDPTYVSALRDFLSEMFPRGLGIPQALNASHVIADAYIERMSRAITRQGYDHNRYADDFRILARTWQSAHQAIEISIHAARQIGLALSDAKLSIRKPDDIRKELSEFEDALQPYKDAAADGLKSLEFVSTEYDDFDLVEIEPGDEEVDYVALERLVKDWLDSDHESPSRIARYVGLALKRLQKADTRLAVNTLVEIVMRDPTRMRSVLHYLAARTSNAESWEALYRLSALPRTSPWSKVWLLNQSARIDAMACDDHANFVSWAREQLGDSSEVVRAEAAWFLAESGKVSESELLDALISASEVTQCGIASAVGRFDALRASTSKLGRAVRQESPLTKAAYSWGNKHGK